MRNLFLSKAVRLLCAVILLCALLAASAISAIGLFDHIEYADAVVVPGNTVNPDGSLSKRLKTRLDAALSVFHAGQCKVIFVSGATGIEGIDESEAMKNYLVSQGVPLSHIIQDKQGHNTAATARNASKALHQRGFKTVLAVSQFFHIPRLRRLLAAQGLIVIGSKHAQYFEPRDLYSTLREVAAMAILFLKQNNSADPSSVTSKTR